MKLGAAVRAAVIEDVRAAALAAVERVVLAHDADRLRVPGREIFAAMDGEPELAHEAPAGRARPRRGDVDQFLSFHAETVVQIPTRHQRAGGTPIAAIEIPNASEARMEKLQQWRQRQEGKMGYILLWALGVPIPVLFVIFLLRGCT